MLPPNTKGKIKLPISINDVAKGGLMEEDIVRTVFVMAAVDALSSAVMMAFTYDCLVGTSIWEMDCLKNRNITAYINVGAKGTIIKKKST